MAHLRSKLLEALDEGAAAHLRSPRSRCRGVRCGLAWRVAFRVRVKACSQSLCLVLAKHEKAPQHSAGDAGGGKQRI